MEFLLDKVVNSQQKKYEKQKKQKQKAENANKGGGVAGSIEERCDVPGCRTLEEIKSLSDDELVKGLCDIYKAFVDYRDGKHEDGSFSMGVYNDKFMQYVDYERVYLERIGIDRNDTDRVSGVLNPLLSDNGVAAAPVAQTEAAEKGGSLEVHVGGSPDKGVDSSDTKVSSVLDQVSDSGKVVDTVSVRSV